MRSDSEWFSSRGCALWCAVKALGVRVVALLLRTVTEPSTSTEEIGTEAFGIASDGEKLLSALFALVMSALPALLAEDLALLLPVVKEGLLLPALPLVETMAFALAEYIAGHFKLPHLFAETWDCLDDLATAFTMIWKIIESKLCDPFPEVCDTVEGIFDAAAFAGAAVAKHLRNVTFPRRRKPPPSSTTIESSSGGGTQRKEQRADRAISQPSTITGAEDATGSVAGVKDSSSAEAGADNNNTLGNLVDNTADSTAESTAEKAADVRTADRSSSSRESLSIPLRESLAPAAVSAGRHLRRMFSLKSRSAQPSSQPSSRASSPRLSIALDSQDPQPQRATNEKEAETGGANTGTGADTGAADSGSGAALSSGRRLQRFLSAKMSESASGQEALKQQLDRNSALLVDCVYGIVLQCK